MQTSILAILDIARFRDRFYQPDAHNWEWAYTSSRLWKGIENQIARELGKFQLAEGRNPFENCQRFLLNCSTHEALDLIEFSFRVIDRVVRDENPNRHDGPRQSPDEAIKELNGRFRQHSLGYEYIGGEIVRKDSQFVHAEAVKPALQLLADKAFCGADEEFRAAHKHYREGNGKDAMVWALKAFESTMKVICDARAWRYDPTDTASKLVEVLIAQELIPKFMSSELTALATVLKSGVPTARNKLAGHGQGAASVVVPPYVAAWTLHVTAANIVLLVEAHKALK